MIKDDQGGTINPYKCMNVMKQDALDDKIKEGCKKHISQQKHNDPTHTHTHTHIHTYTHTKQV